MQNIQQRYEVLEAEKALLNMNDQADMLKLLVIENEQEQLQAQMNEQMGTQAGEDRHHVLPTEHASSKVDKDLIVSPPDSDEIELKYDFNDIFGNMQANKIISELLREQKAALQSLHQNQLSELQSAYEAQEEELESGIELIYQFKQKLENLNTSALEKEDLLSKLTQQNQHLQEQVSRLQQERDEAIATLDHLKAEFNGEAEEQQNEILRLEQLLKQMESRPSAEPSVKMTGTSETLEELVQKAKESAAEKATQQLLASRAEVLPPLVFQPDAAHLQPIPVPTLSEPIAQTDAVAAGHLQEQMKDMLDWKKDIEEWREGEAAWRVDVEKQLSRL
ncbi:hypothetical protein SAMN04487970_100734 [Paenibacillus tianmuensis]|uniref:Uncharacterized protein n=1 Tax=Paenibacillus tianmuensis TaxID=624147 RepID=A0A1G4QGM9_9BACL|nr:hypothetical protein [Paenibacillus tianmuensis]SCW43803.1 hypothetical protein SAMN04487970_100734 [Paenibacillus tianmuensis]